MKAARVPPQSKTTRSTGGHGSSGSTTGRSSGAAKLDEERAEQRAELARAADRPPLEPDRDTRLRLRELALVTGVKAKDLIDEWCARVEARGYAATAAPADELGRLALEDMEDRCG
jgi:hypothetical protein